ncbi:TetR/AcrR family transcriptional regulator [candidate division TA06 bacterium]|uniref:TetR/AcrR family transcriptional regulator n=1 Tax=candidate division TA06 bacterium TaxID=2250710 RepID=A0A933I9Y8_UNCT6|nr:TetR/AcrR family transcriptional regulator [candidate division TA06 bacterium]
MEKLPRKERERLAKKQDILKAAREVFAQKGLHVATLDEIAEKAEFAKGTLYGYFQSKDDLFACMLEEELAKFEQCIKQVLNMPLAPADKVEKLVKTMLLAFEQNEDFLRLLSKERPGISNLQVGKKMMKYFKTLTDAVSELIKEGIRKGVFVTVDSRRTAVALFNLVHGSAMSSLLNKKKISDPKEAKFITDLFLNGIKA